MNTWDLSRIFPNDAAFDASLSSLEDLTKKTASYAGSLGEEEKLNEYLDLSEEAEAVLTPLFEYASMKSDLDKRDTKALSNVSRVMIAYQKFAAANSFADPELIALGEDYAKKFLADHPNHKDSDFAFAKLFRGQKYVLSAEKEKLLSCFAPTMGKGSDLYDMLTTADFIPNKAKLSDGSEVEVNHSNWTALIPSVKTAEDRKAVFEALYKYYDAHKTTYGEIYNLTIQNQLAEKKARGYSSILQEHLYGNAIPEEVFHNLVEAAREGSEPLKKYYRIRAKYLGLEKHRSYDRFLQLAKSEKKFTFEEAKSLFFESIAHYPADYIEKAKEATSEGYVDVMPGPGKRSGAYSSGGYNVHPYILLNFNGELDDVFTLAHESGHSVHTLYAMESQPKEKSGYVIFVAEIASTFNEHNLLDYLINSGKLSKNDEIALLQKSIDEICSTFYRQTLFGDFEERAAKLAEAGQPINHEVLSGIMKELYRDYYGIDIEEEVYKPLVWAYIPHLFHTPFYVYQYATSFTASMMFYDRYKNGVPGAFEDFKNLLKSGGSDYPVALIQKAGVDLTKKEAFVAVTKRMGELVDRLEKLLKD